MTDAMQTLAAWRAEIAAELEAAETELAAASERLTAAEQGAAPARELFLQTQRALEPLQNRRAAIAPPLLQRLHEMKRALEASATTVVQAQHAVAAAERKIADLKAAADQLSVLLPQATDAAEAA